MTRKHYKKTTDFAVRIDESKYQEGYAYLIDFRNKKIYGVPCYQNDMTVYLLDKKEKVLIYGQWKFIPEDEAVKVLLGVSQYAKETYAR